MKKTCLVLEGGSMRGIFSAGVLDVFLENNIEIDAIIGVSAGALFGANSGQKGRALRYNKNYSKDKRFISIRNLLLTGNMVSKNFAFYKMTYELDPFDNDAFKNSGKDFYLVATNVKTGMPEYFKIDDVNKQLEYLRATSALPMASKMIKLENNKYLDGGLSDSIPVKKAIEMGYENIIVVLTQPLKYKKEMIGSKLLSFIKLRYCRYPKLIKTIKNRHIRYNDTIKYINNLEPLGGTEILDLSLEKDILVINLSNEILSINALYEEKMIESIIYSLTSIDGIDKITLKVEGIVLDKLPNSGKKLPSILDRSYGINKNYNLVNTNNIDSYTVYYVSKIKDDSYYVPITKYVNSEGEDKIKVIIDELSTSPIYENNLMSFLNSDVSLIDYKLDSDILSLNFSDSIFIDQGSSDILEEVIYTIGLSFQDNYNVKDVSLLVENKEIYENLLKILE